MGGIIWSSPSRRYQRQQQRQQQQFIYENPNSPGYPLDPYHFTKQGNPVVTPFHGGHVHGYYNTPQQWAINKTQYAGNVGIYSNSVTEGDIYGELITFAPETNRFRNPFAWIQFLTLVWQLVWLVIFAILATAEYDWIHLWAALLGYILGYALLVLVFQGMGLWWYLVRNDLSSSYQHPVYSGDNETGTKNNHYMGHAHSKELEIAVLISVITGALTTWVFWNWLCEYKNSCTYNDNKNALLPNPLNVEEFLKFNTFTVLATLFHLISIVPLIRALYAHWRPLRSITHLIKAVPSGATHLTNYQGGHCGTHLGVIHMQHRQHHRE